LTARERTAKEELESQRRTTARLRHKSSIVRHARLSSTRTYYAKG
jgi:hypothetical protein